MPSLGLQNYLPKYARRFPPAAPPKRVNHGRTVARPKVEKVRTSTCPACQSRMILGNGNFYRCISRDCRLKIAKGASQ